jgi:uncharacterized protein YndB with AHSA1/START domain
MNARSKPAVARESALTLTRVFDAPVRLVFQAWTEGRHLKHWSAPRGFTIPHSEGEAKPGTAWRCCMRRPDGTDLWLGGVYREVVQDRLLVMTHAWDDEDSRPGHETVVTVRFEDLGGQTRVTLHQGPFDSTASRDGHLGGWSECLERLSELLPTLA